MVPRIVAACCLLVLLLAPSVHAHTSQEVSVKCPVCQQAFKTRITGSYTTFGQLRDFEKTGAVGTLYQETVACCPSCHYSWYSGSFEEKVTDDVKARVLKEIKPRYQGKTLTTPQVCAVAAEIGVWRKKKDLAVARLYLVGSYLLRHGDQAERKRFQKLTAQFLEQGLARNEASPGEVAPVSYLIAEMYRRQGQFAAALPWYDKALQAPKPPEGEFLKVVQEQKKLAEAKDDNNKI